MHSLVDSFFFLRLYLFLERGEGRKEERERNINVWFPLAHPQLGTWPATQACALTGNQNSNFSVCRPALNPLSHTSQGHWLIPVCALPRDWTHNFVILERCSNQLSYLTGPVWGFVRAIRFLTFSLRWSSIRKGRKKKRIFTGYLLCAWHFTYIIS